MRTTATVDIILRAIGAGDVRGAFNGIASQAELLGQSLKSIAVGALGVGALGALGRQAMAMADRLDDLSTRLQISTEALQVLDLLARKTGQTADVFTAGIDHMNKALAEAQRGSVSAYRPFQDLHIVLDDFEKLTPERKLEVIARSIAGASDQTLAFDSACEILGARNAPQLRAALTELARGYDTVAKAARDSMEIASTETIRQLALANDEMERWGRRSTIVVARLMAMLRQSFSRDLFGAFLDEVRDAAQDVQHELPALGALPFASATEINDLSNLADYYAAMAEDARVRASAEREAGDWLKLNRTRYQDAIGEMRQAQLSEESRLDVLRAQLAEIERQTAELTERAKGENDLAMIRLKGERARLELVAEIQKLEEKIRRDQEASTKRILARNAEIGGSIAYGPDGKPRVSEDLTITSGKQPMAAIGAGEQARDVDVYQRANVGDSIRDAVDDMRTMGNIFDGLYRSVVDITTGIGRDLGGTISGLILKTKSWSDAWRELGSAILTNVVNSFAQMVAQYAVSQLAIFALSKIFKAKDLAVTTAQATASAAAWTPAAIAASIATLGVAATTGTAAFMAALALGTAASSAVSAATPITALAYGGDYYAGRPYLFGEFGPELAIPRQSGVVMNHRETAEIARQLGAGGTGAASGPSVRDIVLVDSRREAERIRRGSDAEVTIVEIMRDHKYRIFA